ncbi:MAG: AMP-binding protein [Sphingomonas sp.]
MRPRVSATPRGTTGSPKGVVYTHRSNYLHTLRALQADAVGLTESDVLLLAVPMFHANGWGLPFAAPAAGTRLVLPGRMTDGASLARLMRDEGVTIAVGVQTVWLGLVDHLEATGGTLPALERVLIGGSNCPDALIRRMEERLGARVQTSWGMTELSPIGTIAPPNASPEEPARLGAPADGRRPKAHRCRGQHACSAARDPRASQGQGSQRARPLLQGRGRRARRRGLFRHRRPGDDRCRGQPHHLRARQGT